MNNPKQRELRIVGGNETVELLSTRDIADLCGVTPSTVRAWRTRGVGPQHITLRNGRAAYLRPVVDAWLEATHRAAPSEEEQIRQQLAQLQAMA